MRNLGPGGRAVVGLVATVAIGVIGFFGTRAAQGAFAPDYRISVTVGETGQGIIPGSDVAARGVLVGEVGQISLNDDLEAVVELILEPQYTVPRGAVFAIPGGRDRACRRPGRPRHRRVQPHLDDQIPTVRDLSLVAEALGTAGDEFNRLGLTIDLGALETITANQDRLVVLLDELVRFADQLDLVLELTRPDLDRLIIEGDNVTRMLFAYRPEVADLLVGISDYSDTIGNGGLRDPGFAGLGAGFQIIIDETEPLAPLCEGLPPEASALLPICIAQPQLDDPAGEEPAAGGPIPGAPEIPLPELPVPVPLPGLAASGGGLPLLEVPSFTSPQPEARTEGLGALLDGLLSSGALEGEGAP